MADFVRAKFEDITEPRTKAKSRKVVIGEAALREIGTPKSSRSPEAAQDQPRQNPYADIEALVWNELLAAMLHFVETLSFFLELSILPSLGGLRRHKLDSFRQGEPLMETILPTAVVGSYLTT